MTFNGNKDQSTLFINEGYGSSLNVSSYFMLENYDWIPLIFNGDKVTLGGAITDTNVDPFDGSVSCFQIFDYSMDPATVHFKKYCPISQKMDS